MNAVLTREATAAYDVEAVRARFPILKTKMQGQPLVYLDSAASAQKPDVVIDAFKQVYEHDYANIHRGVYEFSQRATALHDAARRKIQGLLNAASWREIVLVRNATEAINLVAYSFLLPKLRPGDEILLTQMEHHANIVPWQLVAGMTGAKVVPAPVTDIGELDWRGFVERINPRTKMIALAWVSNVLGTINPVHDVAKLAREKGIPLLLDASQAVPHIAVDVQEVGADFLAFTGHKVYGPSGVGVLWARQEHLEAMPPWQGGGDMIERVSFSGTTWNEVPFKFEAGTPDIAGTIALGQAVDFVRSLGLDALARHEADLHAYAMRALGQVPGLKVFGTASDKVGVVSFTLDGAHPQDVGTMLDLDGIAIRTGHHCAMPLHERFGLTATARASIGAYTNEADIDALAASLKRVAAMFQ
ncbi:MAG: cysteine desulfurase [Geminicoccaceae bacterium]|nr:cysteine desulfurase [Geminicoccaceae bacterium]